MIHRREILERDPTVDWPTTLAAIRRHGYSASEICFVLNIDRPVYRAWDRGTTKPNFENGRALLKLLESVSKNSPI